MQTNPKFSEIKQTLIPAFVIYYLTTVYVFLAVGIGFSYVPAHDLTYRSKKYDFLHCLAVWDGEWYARIVRDGYSFDPETHSNVAFFPAFPATASLLTTIFGLSPEFALVFVSQVFLLASFLFLGRYLQRFHPESQPLYVLLTLGLFPTSFYLRMAYTEAMFLFSIILFLYGLRSQWPLWGLALVAGFCTSIRMAGICAVALLLWEIWRRAKSKILFLRAAGWLIPLGCWGLLAYILFQAVYLNEPLAFMKAQIFWKERTTTSVFPLSADELVTLRPLWSTYLPNDDCCWAKVAPQDYPLLNLRFTTPIFFVAALGCISLGAYKKWLSREEVLLSYLLILVPYVLQTPRMCMVSQARFAMIVFPVYLVIGRLLQKLPLWCGILFWTVSAGLLACYTALFINWYRFY